MENPFIAIKLFPCPSCNWPLLVSSRFEVKPEVEVLDDWRGTLLGKQAVWHQVVEWNPEIRVKRHMNKKA
jgi:hypothetical protein